MSSYIFHSRKHFVLMQDFKAWLELPAFGGCLWFELFCVRSSAINTFSCYYKLDRKCKGRELHKKGCTESTLELYAPSFKLTIRQGLRQGDFESPKTDTDNL